MKGTKTLNYRSANSAERLFRHLSRPVIHRINKEVARLAPSWGLTYVDEKGKTEAITLTLRPRLIDEKKLKALWQVLQVLDGAFRKIAGLYFQHPNFTELFPFSDRELDWLSVLEDPEYPGGEIASRWDANTTFGDEDWKQGFSFFEVNGVGVGGLWYGPACAEVALRAIVPELWKIDPRFRPLLKPDMRELLLGILLSQRKRLRRTRGSIAFMMEKASGSNYVEFERLADFCRRRGYSALVAEPTDFSFKGEELAANGKKIDILYRDTTLSELCALEEKGHPMQPLREAFRRGQMVSSLEGEFDHKSAFEVFSNPDFDQFFSSKERALFKRHILWTRLLRETRTTDPGGKEVDLLTFARKRQTQLVLKPNRLYGGRGVAFGLDLTRGAWEKKIETALKEPGGWVVQQRGSFRKKRFFRPDGKKVEEKDLYVVSGFFSTSKGLGIVGRMSERTVVNVARRGGLTPILLIK